MIDCLRLCHRRCRYRRRKHSRSLDNRKRKRGQHTVSHMTVREKQQWLNVSSTRNKAKERWKAKNKKQEKRKIRIDRWMDRDRENQCKRSRSSGLVPRSPVHDQLRHVKSPKRRYRIPGHDCSLRQQSANNAPFPASHGRKEPLSLSRYLVAKNKTPVDSAIRPE